MRIGCNGAMFFLVTSVAIAGPIGLGAQTKQQFPDWPVGPVTPVVPAPAPRVVTVLTGEDLYVVQGDGNDQLLSSPAGVAKVTEEVGPIRIRGKFVDSDGKVETRVYDKKQVFIVERVLPGQFELLKVPKGTVERRVLSDGGVDPVDPKPDPKPEPKPDPKPEPVKSFKVIMVYESGDTLTAGQKGVLYGREVEEYLTASCTGGKAGWRRRDKDAPGVNDPAMQSIWSAVEPEFQPPKSTRVPAVVVQVNDKIEIIPLAETPAEMVSILRKYNGGK